MSADPQRHRLVGRSRWSAGSRDTEAIGGGRFYTITRTTESAKKSPKSAEWGVCVCVYTYMCEFGRVMRRGCGDGTLAARTSLKNGFPGLALVTQG